MIRFRVELVRGSWGQIAPQVRERVARAITASANMVASMLRAGYAASIGSGGNFGGRWLDGLHVDVEHGNLRSIITTRHDIPYAGVFEEGASIGGKPLMWIGISGTDAEGVRPKDYPGGLFSVKREGSGRPLMFSITDKQPKYFGIEAVTIPQKWHLRDVQQSVMANFRAVYDAAYKAGV